VDESGPSLVCDFEAKNEACVVVCKAGQFENEVDFVELQSQFPINLPLNLKRE